MDNWVASCEHQDYKNQPVNLDHVWTIEKVNIDVNNKAAYSFADFAIRFVNAYVPHDKDIVWKYTNQDHYKEDLQMLKGKIEFVY